MTDPRFTDPRFDDRYTPPAPLRNENAGGV